MKIVTTPVVIACREVKRPYSGESLGYRWLAAVPNMAGRSPRGEAVPSFRKPYFVMDGLAGIDPERDRETFIARLRDAKYQVTAEV